MSLQSWLVVIPARLGSHRLPNKPLADIHGKPLIARVFDRVRELSQHGAHVVVATDSQEVISVCRKFDCPAVLTSADLASGTDRCAAVAEGSSRDFVLNVQGDEPFVAAADLLRLMTTFAAKPWPMATLAYRSQSWDDFVDPNVVKAVLTTPGVAAYFSRASVPFPRERADFPGFWHHLGVYAFRREALLNFCRMGVGRLEHCERLEQLRAVEAGWEIGLVEAANMSFGVDTQADLDRARALFAEGQLGQ